MWEPFTLTASASPTPADESSAVLGLMVPPEAMAYLAYDGNPLQETVVPLLDLGNMSGDELSDAVLDAIYSEAASQEPFTAEFPHEFGLSHGAVWVRPELSGIDAFRARLAAALATHGATPIQDTLTTLGAGDAVPRIYYDRNPQEFVLDRLALMIGDEVTEIPLGSLAGAALLAAGTAAEFSADGDLLEDSTSPYSAAADVTDTQISAVHGTGSEFVIPILVPEGVPTGDGRIFDPLALTTRDLPIPLMWQVKTGTGHDGSVLVGRIDSVERIPQGLGNARGVFDSGPYGREAERLVHENAFYGITVGIDDTTVRSVILGTSALTAAGHVTEFANEGLTPFHIPVVVPTNTPTGDGRIFDKKSLSHRELPIPLLWQPETATGHDGSVVVGRIDSVEVRDDGLYNARGYLDNGTNGKEVERLIRLGMLRGVSADLDQFEASASKPAEEVLGEDKDKSKTTIKSETIRVSKARSMAVTVVSKPAFEEAFIILGHPQEGEGVQRREYA